MGTPSANQYFEAIHTGPGDPTSPNLYTAAELVAGSFSSAAVSSATSTAVSTVNAAAPDSTSISQARSQAVSAASVGSVADSKAISGSVNTSVADSKAISVSGSTSIADSKAVSVAAATPTLTVVAASQSVSVADSKAVSVASVLAIAVPAFSIRGTGDPLVDTPALQSIAAVACAYAAANNGARLHLTGNFQITDTITINQHRVHVEGDGKFATNVAFTPTATKSLFKFSTGINAVLYQCSLTGMSFTGTNAQTKTILELVDTSEFGIDELSSLGWTGNSNSVGLWFRGRELTSVGNISIQADIPVQISDNPNSTIDCDHLHFNGTIYLLPLGANPCVLVDTGINITNLTMEGDEAWVGGNNGFYWNDTTASTASLNFLFRNIRREQPNDVTASAIYLNSHGGITNVELDNVHMGTGSKGLYGRNLTSLTLRNTLYDDATRLGLDVDGTVTSMHLDNARFQAGSTVSTTGLTEKWAAHIVASAPIAANSYWETTANALAGVRLFGTKHWASNNGNAQLGVGATLALPCTNGAGRKTAIIHVAGYSATGPINEYGIVISSPTNAFLLANSANFAVGNVPGKLTVFHNSGTVQVWNQTAQALDIVVTAEWV